jgi:hypothetical protein
VGIVDEILSDQGSQLAGALTEQAGFNSGEAQSFLPAAVGKVLEAVGGGGFDLSAALGGGDVSSLLSKLDVGTLASETGIETAKATTGLQALIPLLISVLQDKAGGAEAILSLVGGGSGQGALGAVGSLAGKLFNR